MSLRVLTTTIVIIQHVPDTTVPKKKEAQINVAAKIDQNIGKR